MFEQNRERNLSMVMDFYEMTMSNGYFRDGVGQVRAAFDVFYRKNPDEGGFAIFAGLEQVIDYIRNLHFTAADIDFLRQSGGFDEEFLHYLAHFRFTGSLYALREGTVMYPNTPVVTVVAPLIEAQLVETALLLEINHQSLLRPRPTGTVARGSEARGQRLLRAPGAQHRLGRLRRARLLHRRRRFHRHRAGRADVRHPRLGHDGALVGDVLRRRIHRL